MENEMLRAAKAEEQRLEELLRQDPTFLRLEAVRRIIDLYGTRNESARTTDATKERRSRKGSLASVIREIAATHLRNKMGRAKSSEIYQVVLDAGVTVPGQKPMSVVSSYLSGSDMFDNTDEGYGLTEWVDAIIENGSETETPNSNELFGAPKINGSSPLSP
jgi:hypothetical protein